jgi:hypothetical protein
VVGNYLKILEVSYGISVKVSLRRLEDCGEN